MKEKILWMFYLEKHPGAGLTVCYDTYYYYLLASSKFLFIIYREYCDIFSRPINIMVCLYYINVLLYSMVWLLILWPVWFGRFRTLWVRTKTKSLICIRLSPHNNLHHRTKLSQFLLKMRNLLHNVWIILLRECEVQ